MRSPVEGRAAPARWALAAALPALAGCLGIATSGLTPPDPSAFVTSSCGTSTPDAGSPGTTLELGAGWQGFQPFTPATQLQLYTLPTGEEYVYFSAQESGLSPSQVCLTFTLFVSDSSSPEEVVGFDRYLVDLQSLDAGTAQLLGIPGHVVSQQLVSGKRARLEVVLVDPQSRAAYTQVYGQVQ